MVGDGDPADCSTTERRRSYWRTPRNAIYGALHPARKAVRKNKDPPQSFRLSRDQLSPEATGVKSFPGMAAETRLLINIDHVATLRNARRETFPDPVAAAIECELGGADGIVFHLREDRRHINDDDVRRLREAVRSKLDFELSVNREIVAYCCEIGPELATLVPERREEVTTEGGLDVRAGGERLREVIRRLLGSGVEEVALFVDPEPDQIHAAADAGANAVELHTGDFALASGSEEIAAQVLRLSRAGRAARDAGLRLHAGHGLDYVNYPVFHQAIPDVEEVSIGFAIVARALFSGMQSAVRDMAVLVKGGHSQ